MIKSGEAGQQQQQKWEKKERETGNDMTQNDHTLNAKRVCRVHASSSNPNVNCECSRRSQSQNIYGMGLQADADAHRRSRRAVAGWLARAVAFRLTRYASLVASNHAYVIIFESIPFYMSFGATTGACSPFHLRAISTSASGFFLLFF